ncbi:hypothetical protein [Leucobacter luti]|uniref:Protein ImuA n=1 Tax=Leucobacter luti TaxID=340320 RepID=A0A4Q7TXN7_9MICO|nr:hypothetical protein [Leucobacter luti]RZT64658.1 hypothetical protein EV139_2079 [Leucobacter luti]
MNPSATVRSLQQRITQMQPLRLDDRALPTAAPLRPLLPGGALRMGSSYSVHGSLSLALALLTAASAAGSWCGIIGIPTFGAEAAAALGIALDRCILIPHPGADTFGLAGALSEVLTVVLVHAAERPRHGDTERISARLREHGSALITTSSWPHPESSLRVTGSRWSGLGQGEGILGDRELSVQSEDRRGQQQHLVRFTAGALAATPTGAAPPLAATPPLTATPPLAPTPPVALVATLPGSHRASSPEPHGAGELS